MTASVASTRSARKQVGFTLLELLVAIAIFVVMSAMAYGGLSSVLESRKLTDGVTKRIAAIQMTVNFIQRDIEQALDRRVRDEFGSQIASFMAMNTVTCDWSFHAMATPTRPD